MLVNCQPIFLFHFVVASMAICSLDSFAKEKADFNQRLLTKDANQDGKLSRDELGDTLWNRMAGQDANGDGFLDASELKAMAGKSGRKESGQVRPGGANAAFQIREHQASNGQTIRYSLFVPTREKHAPLPMVLCLHGAGGNVEAANLLTVPAMQAKHPCIVVAPACDGKSTRWVESEFRGARDDKKKQPRAVMPELMEMLDAVIAEGNADPSRIYVVGQSMGGVGTWGLIANHPDKFAAAIPVCGFWTPADAPQMSGVAIWAFHGEKDEAVPVSGSRDIIAALKKSAITPKPKYTEFPGVGHGSWGLAYEMAELWDWLFEQRKK